MTTTATLTTPLYVEVFTRREDGELDLHHEHFDAEGGVGSDEYREALQRAFDYAYSPAVFNDDANVTIRVRGSGNITTTLREWGG